MFAQAPLSAPMGGGRAGVESNAWAAGKGHPDGAQMEEAAGEG